MIVGVIVLDQVEQVIKAVLTTYHNHIPSWGLSIILLTFTVRLVILPLTVKQFRSMAAMQTIQPKIKAVQNKYKNKTSREDKQKMQQEMMALYKEHNVNPFASCLPLVAQFPVFIGLYQVLRNQIHSQVDRSFLGIADIFEKLSSIGGVTEYVILALYVLTMLGSTLLFSFVTDRQQKYMFAVMPVAFLFFVVNVPAGVMIYWITTNVWTIAQQGVIKRTMGHRLQPPPAAKSAGGRTPQGAQGAQGGGRRTRQEKGGGRGGRSGKRRRGR